MIDMDNELAAIRSLDLKTASVEEIKTRIARLLPRVTMSWPGVDGQYFWRARKNRWRERFTNVRAMWYPPLEKISTYGRANNIGKPVLYCSDHPYTACAELRPPYDEPYTLLACKKEPEDIVLRVVPLGLGRPFSSTARDGAGRARVSLPPLFSRHGAEPNDYFEKINAFFHEEFTKPVPAGAEFLYKTTVAISEYLLETFVYNPDSPSTEIKVPVYSGIIYSPVNALFGTNVAFSTWYANRFIRPVACWQVIAGRAPKSDGIAIYWLARSIAIKDDGEIEWEEASEPQLFMQREEERVAANTAANTAAPADQKAPLLGR